MLLISYCCVFSPRHSIVLMLATVSYQSRSISQRFIQKIWSSTTCKEYERTRRIVKQITEISASTLVPELHLHVITPRCELWRSSPDQCPVPDPYWAFFWPGGQVLTRYILDNPGLTREKTVLDLGCGGGASSIAALMCAAEMVIGNDVDNVALEAMQMNAILNIEESASVHQKENGEDALKNLHISNSDVLPMLSLAGETVTTSDEALPLQEGLRRLYRPCMLSTLAPAILNRIHVTMEDLDVVFVGDLFYDEEIGKRLFSLLNVIKAVNPKATVLIGDPGRHFISANETARKHLNVVWKCDLPADCVEENFGFSTGFVFEYNS